MKRALIIASVLLASAGMAAVGYFAASEPISAAFSLGFITLLLLGGTSYLVHYFVSMREVDIRDDELDEMEVVWAKTQQGIGHYRSGNPYKFWDTVGGKLFLTSHVLEFRANPAEPFAYRLIIRLEEIRYAEPHRLVGVIPGALRIEREDGSFEIFTFGAAFDVSQEWADAILDFRDDLDEGHDSDEIDED
jgi:hypothetical protein